MSGLFDRMRGRNKDQSSAQKAKERLQLILVHDRINMTPEKLEEMKAEILAVISKYVSIATDSVEIALTQRGDRNHNMLIAEIPFFQSVEGIDKADEEDDPKNQIKPSDNPPTT
ncbi:MAG: cell division topological specificity factor MinE [Anaerolineae bacterium]|jgi:cell division topological specificity factor|nr:cell division topological specificity factor MinE [Anaerolineae bacterium]